MGFLFFVRTDQCGIPRISGNAGKYADMAELADAPDLGSGVHDVQVQVLLSAFNKNWGIPETSAFLGFFCISEKKMGHKRGKL